MSNYLFCHNIYSLNLYEKDITKGMFCDISPAGKIFIIQNPFLLKVLPLQQYRIIRPCPLESH